MPLKERISAFDGLDITPEQREILEAIREFVDREVIPVAKELEARDEFPTKIVEGLRDMGAFGMRIPTEYGGLGLDLVTYALVIAELTRGWMAVSGIVNGQYIVSGMIGAHGTDEQKQNYLPRLAVGEIRSCFSMTEPDAGSDVQAIRTIARREGDEFVIDGNKMWVTNGDRASLIALLVKTDPDADPRHTGMTALLVEKEALVAQQNGLTVSPPLGKLGYHGVESVEFAFEEFRVPVSAVLGGEEMIGKGFYQMMSGIETGRINVASRGLGISLRALELSLEYAQQRSAFGKPIGHHQLIQKKITDMATRIEASKHLILAAAKKKDSGQRADIEAGMAKLYATETCQRCAEEAMRIFGGYGYSTEYEVERLYRDAPLMMIGEGSNEIQETIIAKGLLKRHELI
jgi:alkylation response protein AidB-like acyl-CoA dehydrogenase